MYKREALEKKIATLKASINTISFQLRHLKNYTPSLQLKLWRKHRSKLKAELKQYEDKFKSYYGNQFSTNS